MNGLPGTNDSAEDLYRPVGDDLIGIHIGGGSGSGLEDVEDEVPIEASISDLEGSFDDGPAQLDVEQLQVHVGSGCREFDKTQRPNEFPREANSADLKVLHCPLGLRAIQGIPWDPHFPH
jgi:hypothetical protein